MNEESKKQFGKDVENIFNWSLVVIVFTLFWLGAISKRYNSGKIILVISTNIHQALVGLFNIGQSFPNLFFYGFYFIVAIWLYMILTPLIRRLRRNNQ